MKTLRPLLINFSEQQKYKDQFKAAFGTDEINSTRFLQALSQFMATMVSANAPYDKYIRQEGFQFTKISWRDMQYLNNIAPLAMQQIYLPTNHFATMDLAQSGDLIKDQGREEITLNPKIEASLKFQACEMLNTPLHTCTTEN